MRISSYLDEVYLMIKKEYKDYDVTLGKLSKSLRSIAIVLMPTGNRIFYQGHRDINLQYQILVKSINHRQALQISEKITNELITDGNEVYSEPSFLSQDEQACIYTTAYTKII